MNPEPILERIENIESRMKKVDEIQQRIMALEIQKIMSNPFDPRNIHLRESEKRHENT